MKGVTIKELYDLNKTIAKKILEDFLYPWEVLSEIKECIVSIGNTLSLEEYEHPSEDIWISKSAKVSSSAWIEGPCIVGHGAEIRHCAFIRPNVIVGNNCIVGNSTELKNTILFDEVQVPHFNYVGDSILGYKSHFGAGVITANLKLNKKLVKIKQSNEEIETGLKKVGSFVGDNVEVGCNSVLSPGTIIGKNSVIYPLSNVHGILLDNSVYKKDN